MRAIIGFGESLYRYINVLTFTPVLHDESGQDLLEYALILGLIAMAAVATMQGLAANIGTAVGNLGTKLTAYTS
jgi:pilus assembly protein Flp/PilA